MFTWAGSSENDAINRKAGLNPVPMEVTDILPGLQTGLIEVVAMPPFYALSSQVYLGANHMLDLGWAPLVGACIVSKKTWDTVPEEAKAEMLEAAKVAGAQIKKDARQESLDSIETMKTKWGMTVHPCPPALRSKWCSFCEPLYPEIRGKIVPAGIWDQVLEWLEEYRAKTAKNLAGANP